MSQGMDRPKMNIGDTFWAIFPFLSLAALKYPCCVVGSSLHLEVSYPWGFEGGRRSWS